MFENMIELQDRCLLCSPRKDYSVAKCRFLLKIRSQLSRIPRQLKHVESECLYDSLQSQEESVRKIAGNLYRAESSFRVKGQHGSQQDFTQDMSSVRHDPEGSQEGNLQSSRDGPKQNRKEIKQKSDPECS